MSIYDQIQINQMSERTEEKENSSGPTKANGTGATGDENLLKYTNDAGFFPGDHPPDEELLPTRNQNSLTAPRPTCQ
ncbi:hypothetical protein SAY87_022083 [Trapa incisa]|uniref:Uncharacterized protein n=2 Tax=Trapa TaxID=22665 RepID=A0AAN7M758_TRANT|nr:hypothetical protein SAY87_022083 [Trapa incisa]KAK4804238.1 hypothetical protein SAY86_004055 [Trapa natans]